MSKITITTLSSLVDGAFSKKTFFESVEGFSKKSNIICNFIKFKCRFNLQQIQQSLISSKTEFIHNLHHKFPNFLTINSLGNLEIL